MFRSAEELLLEGIDRERPRHVLGFYWKGFEPRLVFPGAPGARRMEEPLLLADFTVGRERRCVGRFEGGRHIPCPHDVLVTGFSQCDECAGEAYIWDQECIFDPKCDGTACVSKAGAGRPSDFCRRKHVLYLAFYGPMPKVGMSSTKRIKERLVEQGADACAIIGTYPSRLAAREAEKDISKSFGIPEWYRQAEVLGKLSQPVNPDAITAEYERLLNVLGRRDGIEFEELRFLDGYPLRQPLGGTPELQETSGIHKGRFIGVKGKWLIYESRGLKALNMPDLVARFIAR